MIAPITVIVIVRMGLSLLLQLWLYIKANLEHHNPVMTFCWGKQFTECELPISYSSFPCSLAAMAGRDPSRVNLQQEAARIV